MMKFNTMAVNPAIHDKYYLIVSVTVSVVFFVVVPLPSGVDGVAVVCVSTVVDLSDVLPSLVCETFVSVLFSVVPFLVSQPMVNTPSAAIRSNARKLFIVIPFLKSWLRLPSGRNHSGRGRYI
jgi:hypothetical protein